MNGLRTSLAAGLLAAAVVPVWAGPAAADHQAPCSVGELPDSERLADTHTKDNPAFDRMHVEEAQEVATGRGVKVAVIDSGVRAVDGLDIAGSQVVAGAPSLLSGHGTIVAGLIAGPRGVAPDAQVFDVKVFDADGADTDAGRAAAHLGRASSPASTRSSTRTAAQQFDVVNISLAVGVSDPQLEAAIARLVALPLVVVAAAGNNEEAPELRRRHVRGHPRQRRRRLSRRLPRRPRRQRHARRRRGPQRPTSYPTRTPTSLPPPPAPSRSTPPGRSATSTRSPPRGLRPRSAASSRCCASSTRARPRAQLVARLQGTTEGPGVQERDLVNPWTGAGVVQAHDALTRQIKPGRQGKIESTVAEIRADAQAPPAPGRSTC